MYYSIKHSMGDDASRRPPGDIREIQGDVREIQLITVVERLLVVVVLRHDREEPGESPSVN